MNQDWLEVSNHVWMRHSVQKANEAVIIPTGQMVRVRWKIHLFAIAKKSTFSPMPLYGCYLRRIKASLLMNNAYLLTEMLAWIRNPGTTASSDGSREYSLKLNSKEALRMNKGAWLKVKASMWPLLAKVIAFLRNMAKLARQTIYYCVNGIMSDSMIAAGGNGKFNSPEAVQMKKVTSGSTPEKLSGWIKKTQPNANLSPLQMDNGDVAQTCSEFDMMNDGVYRVGSPSSSEWFCLWCW